MKHAGQKSLEQLSPMLQRLRGHSALKERTPGSFYRKSNAFLHFHEDNALLFADIKRGKTGFERYEVSSAEQQAEFLAIALACLASS